MKLWWQSGLVCTEEERVRLPPSPLPALGLGGPPIRIEAARRNMTMSDSHDEVRGRELAMTWELDLDLGVDTATPQLISDFARGAL